MNRDTRRCGPDEASVPRTRGDEPARDLLSPARQVRSPHTRG